MMLNIALFDTLGRHFRFFFGDGGVKEIHFCPQTNKFFGRDRVGLIFEFANDFALMELYRGWVFGYPLVS